MGETTGISWTQHTWNPHVGCTRVSEGCRHCYMFAEMKRYGRDPSVVVRTKTWDQPRRWQKAAQATGRREMVFTCSWSDWFHADADPWRDEAWEVVRACPNLIFQVLTKRPDRILDHLPADWGAGYPNVWLGVSVEDQAAADRRVPLLLGVPAAVRFLSIEPLLGAVDLRERFEGGGLREYLTGQFRGIRCKGVNGNPDFEVDTCDPKLRRVDWVIVGGESGPDARPCDVGWVRSLVSQCQQAGGPCFVKQLGAAPRDGRTGTGPVDADDFPRCWRCGHYDFGPCADGTLLCNGCDAAWDRFRDPKGGDPAEWPADLRVRQFPAALAPY